MSLPRLRRRIDEETFALWRAALPGLGLPAWFDSGPGAGGTRAAGAAPSEPIPTELIPLARGVTVPPVVAAALALQTDPLVTVLFAVLVGGSATTGCVALDGGVVSSLVRRRPAEEEAMVEVALVPTERAVAEVLRWIPARPAAAAALEVQVIQHDQAATASVVRWSAGDGEGWRVLPDDVGDGGPVDVSTLAGQLRFVLTGCLTVREAG
jgi:hypothetical protein